MLPASIQLLLTARVGSLAVEDRRVLQEASVIGRNFDYELLAAVAGPSRDLMPHLAAAEAADLLRYDGAAHDFSFKHVLLRDALYDSMLASRRADQKPVSMVTARTGTLWSLAYGDFARFRTPWSCHDEN